MCVFDFETGNNEAEGDGDSSSVGKVTKQLEQQALEDKEEDAEEGLCLTSYLVPLSSKVFHGKTAVIAANGL